MSLVAVRIEDALGQPCPTRAGRFLVEEATEIWLRDLPPGAHLSLGSLPPAPAATAGPTRIPLGHAVGRLELRVRWGEGEGSLPLEVIPRRDKLTDGEWAGLLTHLEEELAGISHGGEGPRGGAVGREGVPAPLALEALLGLVPALERALAALLRRPRTQEHTIIAERPLRQVRRVGRDTLGWLGRHPGVAQWLNPATSAHLGGVEPLVPITLIDETLDAPVNRYIAFLIRRVCEGLRRSGAALEAVAGAAGVSDEGRIFCLRRGRLLREGAARLALQWRQGPLGHLLPAPPGEGALQLILDHPTYGRVHRLATRLISPHFSLEGRGPEAAVRPSYGLYELWTFFALWRGLEAALPGARWRGLGLRRLLSLRGSGGGARFLGTVDGLEVGVHFNRTFPGYLRNIRLGPYTISAERRPDLVVTLRQGGASSWLCLDAKYRSGGQNLGDALSSAHIYRDSLRWDAFGGRCRGALLLAPRMDEDTAPFFSPAYWEAHGVGIRDLRPGIDPAALGGWILGVLGLDAAERG